MPACQVCQLNGSIADMQGHERPCRARAERAVQQALNWLEVHPGGTEENWMPVVEAEWLLDPNTCRWVSVEVSRRRPRTPEQLEAEMAAMDVGPPQACPYCWGPLDSNHLPQCLRQLNDIAEATALGNFGDIRQDRDDAISRTVERSRLWGHRRLTNEAHRWLVARLDALSPPGAPDELELARARLTGANLLYHFQNMVAVRDPRSRAERERNFVNTYGTSYPPGELQSRNPAGGVPLEPPQPRTVAEIARGLRASTRAIEERGLAPIDPTVFPAPDCQLCGYNPPPEEFSAHLVTCRDLIEQASLEILRGTYGDPRSAPPPTEPFLGYQGARRNLTTRRIVNWAIRELDPSSVFQGAFQISTSEWREMFDHFLRTALLDRPAPSPGPAEVVEQTIRTALNQTVGRSPDPSPADLETRNLLTARDLVDATVTRLERAAAQGLGSYHLLLSLAHGLRNRIVDRLPLSERGPGPREAVPAVPPSTPPVPNRKSAWVLLTQDGSEEPVDDSSNSPSRG